MIEIFIIIWVVRLFMSTAFDKGYVRWQWGAIGALSYYLPIIINSLVVFPLLINEGIMTMPQGGFAWEFILLNLLIGGTCCFIAFQILKRLPDKNTDGHSDVLDA
jgi:hypothetical protein